MSLSRRTLLMRGLAVPATMPFLHIAKASGQDISGLAAKTSPLAVPRPAQTAIEDLLVHGAHLKSGQRVVIAASVDGLYGGDNLVDTVAIEWIERAVRDHGARPTVIWSEASNRFAEWRFPAEVREALASADLMINHSFDLTVEEIMEFRTYVESSPKIPMVRNFATTANLLNTAWASTPQELVNEIRFRASEKIITGAPWKLSDPNGTELAGKIAPARDPKAGYAVKRDAGYYYPWPEWVCPPINLHSVNGKLVFDRTLSWWSRYIGIAPYFEQPITIQVENSRIVAIEGGSEARALRAFMEKLRTEVALGEDVYAFNTLHFGVHPQARVTPHQCASVLYRRMIEHSDAHNLHAHIGSAKSTKAFPFWPHITADLRHCNFAIGDNQIHHDGRLTVLDDPALREIEKRYRGRPGVDPEPFQA